ncbi:MAG: GNAT family N-acetyltransferase [Deltaproteobacteria bacterium]
MKTERATLDDIPEICLLFYETIQNINIKDYTIEEVNDWSSWHKDHDKWAQKILDQHFLLVREENKIVGFGSVSMEGYLDLLFVQKDFQRRGIATILINEIEAFTRSKNIDKLTSEVSITAAGFFLNSGFIIESRQKKKSRNLYLDNFMMSKKLKSL